MASRENIKVAVFVAGTEIYGIEKVLLSQCETSRNKNYGINFHYVCLHEGDLYQKLLDLGGNVKIIGGRIPKAYPPNLVKMAGIFFSHLKTSVEIFNKIRAYLEEARPDLVYSHNVTLHVLGGLAAKTCGIKAVGHFHGQLNRKRNWGVSRILLSWWLSLCLDMGISISEAVRKSLWGAMKAKTYRIYNGFDAPVIRQRGEQLADRKDCAGADVVSVGRLVNIKKYEVLIQALNILVRQGLDLNLVLVGGPAVDSNPYYVKLRKQVTKLGLSERVRFAGYIQEPYGIIAKSKVSVLCCTIEGLGNVVLESMACGTPVVVANAGGPSEVIKHNENGLKFTPDNAEELAECLRTIITDNERAQRFVEKAYVDVVEKFSIELHMRQLRERFCSVLS